MMNFAIFVSTCSRLSKYVEFRLVADNRISGVPPNNLVAAVIRIAAPKTVSLSANSRAKC